MSRPGDPGRRQITADGFAGRGRGAPLRRASAELTRRYARGRKPVTRTVTGTAVVEPGGRHDQGMVNAVVELLEKLGANVVLLTGGGES